MRTRFVAALAAVTAISVVPLAPLPSVASPSPGTWGNSLGNSGELGVQLGGTRWATRGNSVGNSRELGEADGGSREGKGGAQVSLITGDRLNVSTAGGKTSVSVASKRNVVFETWTAKGHTYVLPKDAAPLVRRGVLDQNLFDVTTLTAQGDASRQTKVVVSYAGARRAQAALRTAKTLRSINGAAGTITRDRAPEFWRSVRSGDYKHVWLDRKLRVALDQSVPMIGAPTAWQAGFDGTGVDVAVLDTGIDATHPDLAGKVGAQQDFSENNGSVKDGHGHGTHVASTIVGSGAASDGKRKGVAPGAKLMVGKVLADDGWGYTSWILAGMEWSATHGAEIVSMSLGGDATDGTDPLSKAVDDLTASTGALFVIASGNYGPSDFSVTSPGAASSALTVGNVTKKGELASTSGRGPRRGDFAIKPEITAPGTDIVAARAAGTTMGTPVDANYTSASGTSMATPHVAGSAALLLQEHPRWSASELKAALISTAVPHDKQTVFQQGGGRVDVGRAVSQQVHAGPGVLNFGFFRYPQDSGPPVTKPFTVTNDGSAPVTLNLTASASDSAGKPVGAGVLTLGASSLTVPAHSSASVSVTVDPRAGTPGRFGGFVNASSSDGAVKVSLPLGFYKEPESYDMQLSAINRRGEPARGASIQVANVDDPDLFYTFPDLYSGNGTASLRLPAGTYSFMGMIDTNDGETYSYAMVGDPQVEVRGPGVSVVVDARKALPVTASVSSPTHQVTAKMQFYRMPVTGGAVAYGVLLGGPVYRTYAQPTETVTKGEFHLVTQFSLEKPDLVLSGSSLSTLVTSYFGYSGKLAAGARRLGVVDAGSGSVSDFAGVDASGKIALIEAGTVGPSQALRNAHAAGAVLGLFYWREDLPLNGYIEPGLPIPGTTVTKSQGIALQAWIKAHPSWALSVGSVPQSPYLYDLRFDEDARIPTRLRYSVSPLQLASVAGSYRTGAPGWKGSEVRAAFAEWQDFSIDSNRAVDMGATRTDFITVNPALRWLRTVNGYDTMEVTGKTMFGAFEAYPRRSFRSETWFGAPSQPVYQVQPTPHKQVLIPCAGCRDKEKLYLWMQDPGDSTPGHYGILYDNYGSLATKVFRNDQLLISRRSPRVALPTTPDVADYRVEVETTSKAAWTVLSTKTKTVWGFRSGAPSYLGGLPPHYSCTQGVPSRECAFLPMVFLNYDLGLDAQNRAPGGAPYKIGISVSGVPYTPKPDVRDVDVQVSYDDGTTWTNAKVVRTFGGHDAWVRHPAGPGFVSLRVTAKATNGSTISEEITRAYALR